MQTLALFGQTALHRGVVECTEPYSEINALQKLLYKHRVKNTRKDHKTQTVALGREHILYCQTTDATKTQRD